MLRVVTGTAKFATFQRRVGSRPLAAGLLELLWHFTASNAADGAIGRHSDEEIEAWIGWDGEPGALIAALIGSRWLEPVDGDGRLYVHDWHDHADRSVHTKLARERRFFSNGGAPKLGYLALAERASALDWYRINATPKQHQQSSGQGQGQDLRPGAGAGAGTQSPARAARSRVKAAPPAVWTLQAAEALAVCVARRWSGARPPESLVAWARELGRLKATQAEVEALLAWYVSPTLDAVPYIPEARAAKSFRTKWDALVAAKQRLTRPLEPVRRFGAPPTVEEIREAFHRQGGART